MYTATHAGQFTLTHTSVDTSTMYHGCIILAVQSDEVE